MAGSPFESLFARDPSPDARDVRVASDALNVSQFNLFRAAYRWWFGRDASDRELEPPFVRFLYTAVAPPWVRQFVREVIGRSRRGTLDARRYGLAPVPQSSGVNDWQRLLSAVHFALWTVAVAVLAVGLLR